MRQPRPRTDTAPAFALETLEPRIVLDGTPANPANPVVEIDTNYGNIYLELFPDIAPVTVANFMGYVERDDWDGTFFHRLVDGFVLQGGGWWWDEDRQSVEHVVQQDPIVNEYNRSNTRWTVAMAKLGGDPDSATSEWFINLADNSENLDNQNGGFTVFGIVVGGREVVNTITDLRVVNVGSPFTNLPVGDDFDPQGDTISNDDLVLIEDINLVYDPDTSTLADTSVVPGGASNGANHTTVTITSQFGRAIAFQQVGLNGGWTVTDLNLKTDQSGSSTSPVTWIDPKDGATYAAAVSDQGLLLYKHLSDNDWSVRNLNSEIPGVDFISSSLTSFISTGNVFLAGLTSDGEFVIYRQTGGETGGDYTWTGRNISTTDLTVDDVDTTPVFTSPLTAYVPSWNVPTVVGLDADGDIQAIWFTQGKWTAVNLSNITKAPPMVGTIAPYLTTWDAINLTGTDASGNVVVTWWIPRFGGEWVQTNLTTLRSGPTVDVGSIATYVTPWGGTNIIGIADGDVVAYWWAPVLGPGQWRTTNLSDLIEGAETPVGPTIGFSSPSGVVNIVGAADDGDLIRYWWRADDGWQWENVSDTAELA